MTTIRRAADNELILATIEKYMLTTPADVWFSKCVRERSAWRCESCGKQYPEGAQGIHCSHFVGRGNWSVRHEPLNADAHCFYCHQQFESNPHKHTDWKKERLGNLYDILIEKSNNITLGKQARQEKKQMAAHYKKEYERMRESRANGAIGRIEFQGYL